MTALLLYEAYGCTKSAREWSEDPRCMVTLDTFRRRMSREWEVMRALSEPFGGNATRGKKPPNPPGDTLNANGVSRWQTERFALDIPTRITNFAMPAGSYVPPFMGRIA